MTVVDPEETRRTSFDRNAKKYDDARPSYPDAAIDEVIGRSGIRKGGCIVEVGAGTGKATVPLARRGFRLLALEPGARMAAVLRRNVSAYPHVSVLETTFEDWPGPDRPVDLVVAAQAFHWVRSDVRYTKAAAMLRPGGLFGWVSNEKGEFDAELRLGLDEAYARWFPTARPRETYRPGVTFSETVGELEASGLFEPAEVRTFPWTATYTSQGYVDLLDTYSDHTIQPPSVRLRLYRAIKSLLDRRGGVVEIPYVTVVLSAVRR